MSWTCKAKGLVPGLSQACLQSSRIKITRKVSGLKWGQVGSEGKKSWAENLFQGYKGYGGKSRGTVIVDWILTLLHVQVVERNFEKGDCCWSLAKPDFKLTTYPKVLNFKAPISNLFDLLVLTI